MLYNVLGMPRCELLTKNMIKMITIKLEEWQVKNLREYFGHNDKTQTSHWAYEVFNKAIKEQCDIPVVGVRSEQLNHYRGTTSKECSNYDPPSDYKGFRS